MSNAGTLNVTTPNDTQIVITREFNAPRRLVWEAHTKPEFLRRWLFGPPGWEMTQCDEDLRVGGKFRWAWSGPGDTGMSMHGVYREVTPPTEGGGGGRIVRTEVFESGCGPIGAEQLAMVEFIEKGGRTLLKITVTYPTKEARDGMLASGMDQGMAAGYARLDELLAGM